MHVGVSQWLVEEMCRRGLEVGPLRVSGGPCGGGGLGGLE